MQYNNDAEYVAMTQNTIFSVNFDGVKIPCVASGPAVAESVRHLSDVPQGPLNTFEAGLDQIMAAARRIAEEGRFTSEGHLFITRRDVNRGLHST